MPQTLVECPRCGETVLKVIYTPADSARSIDLLLDNEPRSVVTPTKGGWISIVAYRRHRETCEAMQGPPAVGANALAETAAEATKEISEEEAKAANGEDDDEQC